MVSTHRSHFASGGCKVNILSGGKVAHQTPGCVRRQSSGPQTMYARTCGTCGMFVHEPWIGPWIPCATHDRTAPQIGVPSGNPNLGATYLSTSLGAVRKEKPRISIIGREPITWAGLLARRWTEQLANKGAVRRSPPQLSTRSLMWKKPSLLPGP